MCWTDSWSAQVDADALGLHDYHDFVKTPMDLGTVKRNVDAQKYEKKEEFYDHVMLTFDNALTYNPNHDDCYKAASQLKQRFKDAWDRWEVEASIAEGKECYKCETCSETFWWPAEKYGASIADHLRGHCTASSAPHVAGSFKERKDQGWGELLDERLVEPGDTIFPPSRSENKGRRAVVQSNGKLLENGVDVAWIDPVAFCVRNNEWKESGCYLKDRNRFLSCTRFGAKSGEVEKLSDLKEETRKRQRGSQGDEEVPKNISDTSHLPPVKGAIVKVRLENEHGVIGWQDAKLTKYIKETGEWKIKLDVCDGSSRRKSRIMSPPTTLVLSGELSKHQRRCLGAYTLVAGCAAHGRPVWRHEREDRCIARLASGGWAVQKAVGVNGDSILILSDENVLFPHQSRVLWKEWDGKGRWLDAEGLKCDADPPPEESQGQCRGCYECLFQLAPNDRGW